MNNNIIHVLNESNVDTLNAGSQIDGMSQLIKEAELSMGPGLNVMVLACHWRYYAAEDLEGLKRLGSKINYRMVEIPCSGQVHSEWITTAIDSGADAVLVMGGHPSTCHFAKCKKCGNSMIKKDVAHAELHPARLSIDWSEGDRSVRFCKSMDSLVRSIETN